jgi:antitoxin component YwqK of YwqJK toxin-antitoxin module
MNKASTIIVLCLIFLSFSACSKKDQEVVIKTYPNGEKKETAVLKEEKQKKVRIKSFEYYETGERKRQYHYRNNKYYGPWTYWYRHGSKIAEGVFDEETTRPGQAVGNALYYWPGGNKMLFVQVQEKGGDSNITEYYDISGNSYSDTTIPDDLKKEIRQVITDWTEGKI